ncbi:hypothetical protein [Subtercola vilae]|uniref:hypothetical protein n=1 Tax=Subtercola vilae TaxID=2056433 RepID=UPI0010AAABD1|nr:hypothetical protein [Subtercola vilae]
MAAVTGKKVSARDRARQAIAGGLAHELAAQEEAERARLAERERVSRARETATTAYFEAEDRRDALVAELAALDLDRAGAIKELDTLGLKTDTIATVLSITETEIRRLRKLSPTTPETAPVDGAAHNENNNPEQ